MKDLRRRVVVVGSLNIDYIASVDRLPHPGETVLGNQLVQRFGGKGTKQAIGAARQGGLAVLVKDCTLGGRYPVLAVVTIERSTCAEFGRNRPAASWLRPAWLAPHPNTPGNCHSQPA